MRRRLTLIAAVCAVAASGLWAVGCAGEDREQAASPSPAPARTKEQQDARAAPNARQKAAAPPKAPRKRTPVAPTAKPRSHAASSGDPVCAPAGRVHAVGGQAVVYAGVAKRPTITRHVPGGEELASFGVANANGHATVFALRGVVHDECGRLWYYTYLPVRPNGVSGYVLARDVRVFAVRTRIIVDLSERQLTLYRDGKPVLRTSAAVGAPATPTPTGHYYVNQRLIPSDPNGPWGPGAVGISAFSDVLQGWTQGGPIAIHGTNEPSSIGEAVSHGCIRLSNNVLRKVFAATDAGTPVIIQA